eukprot:15129383-Alexandrium_andersonii.AAC.1
MCIRDRPPSGAPGARAQAPTAASPTLCWVQGGASAGIAAAPGRHRRAPSPQTPSRCSPPHRAC